MRLSQEQYDALTPYAQHFETMLRAKWARNPGSAALDIMHGIYVQVTGDKQRFNKGCSHCIMRLLNDLGRIYLADRQERIDRENDRNAVALSLEEKKTVKTRVARTRTRK